jgi:diguanylate cyclase (GGDEF)-like protein
MKTMFLNFLHSGRTFSKEEEYTKYKYLFLNNVIGFAAVVALLMGFIRLQQGNTLMGDIDLLFSMVFAFLLLRLRSETEDIERLSHIVILTAYLLFTALYLLEPAQSTRLQLYYLLVASAFFLKGKRIGFYWLLAVISTIVFFHLSGLAEQGYTHFDIFSASIYLVALFFILNLYEDVKKAQSSALQDLNTNLESLIAQRTEELEIANTELKKEKELLQTISLTDQLTGLHNRFRIRDIFNHEKACAEREESDLAIIMIDIDHFKAVNDTYGHNAGDEVLKAFAQILKRSLREYENIVRWGGEEFLILLPRTDMEAARKIAQRLRQEIRTHYFTGVGHRTASFGIAVCAPEDTFDTLVSRADRALYRAKKKGRDCIESQQQ